MIRLLFAWGEFVENPNSMQRLVFLSQFSAMHPKMIPKVCKSLEKALNFGIKYSFCHLVFSKIGFDTKNRRIFLVEAEKLDTFLECCRETGGFFLVMHRIGKKILSDAEKRERLPKEPLPVIYFKTTPFAPKAVYLAKSSCKALTLFGNSFSAK